MAYAVNRAVGTAVRRNRLRRRLRAAVRASVPAPGAYLLSAGPAAAELTYEQLAAHVRAVLGPA